MGVPSDLDELYQLYARDIDEGQLIHDLKSKRKHFVARSIEKTRSSRRSAHSPRSVGGAAAGPATGGKNPIPSTLPFLSQIAEEDLTSASTSVTSFHLPNSIVRRHHPNPMPNGRTHSDHDLFVRVNDETANPSSTLLQDSTSKPTSYAHFNFDQASKQLAKGNSMVSISSDSVDVPLNNGETGATRRKVHTTSPPNEFAADPKSSSTTNKINLRKQTQDIAARAAQRRANRHHKELMEDMGKRPVKPIAIGETFCL